LEIQYCKLEGFIIEGTTSIWTILERSKISVARIVGFPKIVI